LNFSSILFFYENDTQYYQEVDQHACGHGFGRSNPASQESGVESGTPCSSVALDVFEIEDAWCGKLENYPYGEIPNSIQP
jgi:hypothetical protein